MQLAEPATQILITDVKDITIQMSFLTFSIRETAIEQLTVLNGFSNYLVEVVNERDSNRSKSI